MRAYRKYMTLVLLFISATTGFAQDVTVTAKLDTGAMLIGDHVGMTLQYTGPAQSRVIWPYLPDTILQNISVIGRGKVDTTFSADKKSVTYSQKLSITCFDSGFYTIPPLPVRYSVPPDTTVLQTATSMLMLAVHTMAVDTTKAIKPIIGPLKVPITFREVLPWILLGLAVALVVAAGVWYYFRRKKNQPVFVLKPAITIPAHEKAFHELEQLRLKKLWQSGQVKQYYSELTEILRRYIEERFRVPALEQTSSEIADGLRGHSECERDAINRLSRVLVQADMVKFAKAQPLATENEQSFAESVEFIRATVPAPVIPRQGEGTPIQ